MPRILGPVLLAAFVWGRLVPRLRVAADDWWEVPILRALELRPLPERIHAVLFDTAGQGHLKPVQDLILVMFHAVAGDDGFVRCVMALYAILHLATALLLGGLARRLGATPVAAALAGAIAVVHPVTAEPMSAVLFAPSIPGLFFLLLAVASMTGRGAPSACRAALACASLVLAMGCNPSFLVSGPPALAGAALLTGGRRRIIAALLAGAAALGLVAFHRHAVQGTVTTVMDPYRHLSPSHDVPAFLGEVFDSVIALGPSETETVARPFDGASSGRPAPEGGALWFAVTALAALAAAAAVLGARDPAPRCGGGAPWRPALFGALLAVSLLSPYFLFLGTAAPHRYAQPAVFGLALVVAGPVAAALERLRRRMAGRAGLLLRPILLGALLLPLVTVSSERAESIAIAHRLSASVVADIAGALATEPAVTEVHVLGLPRVVGQGGLVFLVEDALRVALVTRLQRRIDVVGFGGSLLAAWADGRASLAPLPRRAHFALDGLQVRRLAGPADLARAIPAADGEILRSAWRLGEDEATLDRLGGRDGGVAAVTARLLAAEGPRGTAILARALAALREPEPVSAPPRTFAALADPGVRGFAAQVAGIAPPTFHAVPAPAAPDPGEASPAARDLDLVIDVPEGFALRPGGDSATGVAVVEAAPGTAGVSPDIAVVVAWRFTAEGRPPVGGRSVAPGTGLDPGFRRRIACAIAPPPAGAWDLEIWVEAGDLRRSAVIRLPGVLSMP